MMRHSTRFDAKTKQNDVPSNEANANDEKSNDEKEKDQIRYMYHNDIPQARSAFVRIFPANVDKKTLKLKRDRGLVEIASVPQKVNVLEWGTTVIFFNANTVNFVDSFNLMNDDKEYRKHIEALDATAWSEKINFVEDFERAGRDVNIIKKRAFKQGRETGIQEVCELVSNQVLIFLAIKMVGALTETLIKRRGTQRVLEHLPYCCFEKSGLGILQGMSNEYNKTNDAHHFGDIDWDKFVDVVGIANVAKKVSKKDPPDVYFYADIQCIDYTET